MCEDKQEYDHFIRWKKGDIYTSVMNHVKPIIHFKNKEQFIAEDIFEISKLTLFLILTLLQF